MHAERSTEPPALALGFMIKVKKILESICVLCGKLKGSPHLDPRLAEIVRIVRDPKKRLMAVHKLIKTKNVCELDTLEEEDKKDGQDAEEPKKGHGGCGHHQPQIRKEGLKLIMVYSKGKDEVRFLHSLACPREKADHMQQEGNPLQPERKVLTASAAHTLLRKIPSADLAILGLNETEAHPSWMILTVLPVPPPPVRPSIAVDGGATRGEDDLTYKLIEIIRANSSLRKFEEEGAPAHIVSEFETLLQVRRASYSLRALAD